MPELIKGADAISVLTKYLPCLKLNDKRYVSRYLRNLKPGEVRAICGAGFQIVSCAERNEPTKVSYFTKAQGIADGQWAVRLAQSLGQPVGSAIYFTVDYGCPPQDHPRVIEYFRGVNQGVAESGYKIGGYAPGSVLTKLLAQNLIRYAWLPNARSWQQGFTNWNIKQGSQTTLCDVQIDPDEAQGDFGAWSVGEVASQPVVPSQAPAQTPAAYTVKAGDSLSKIAKTHSVSLDALLNANSIVVTHVIHPGDKLMIPA